MFGTCGSPCKRKFGWFGGGGKNHVCSKTGLMVPPECGHFFDHLQITSILAHMISSTNNARFPRFCIFLNFFEFIMPLDWLQKTSFYASRWHCKVLFLQNFFHSHVWHMWVTMYNKIWVIWRWWKKSRMLKTWLKLTKWSLQNAMIFSTTSRSPLYWHTWFIAQTKLVFQGFIIFWIFINL